MADDNDQVSRCWGENSRTHAMHWFSSLSLAMPAKALFPCQELPERQNPTCERQMIEYKAVWSFSTSQQGSGAAHKDCLVGSRHKADDAGPLGSMHGPDQSRHGDQRSGVLLLRGYQPAVLQHVLCSEAFGSHATYPMCNVSSCQKQLLAVSFWAIPAMPAKICSKGQKILLCL